MSSSALDLEASRPLIPDGRHEEGDGEHAGESSARSTTTINGAPSSPPSSSPPQDAAARQASLLRQLSTSFTDTRRRQQALGPLTICCFGLGFCFLFLMLLGVLGCSITSMVFAFRAYNRYSDQDRFHCDKPLVKIDLALGVLFASMFGIACSLGASTAVTRCVSFLVGTAQLVLGILLLVWSSGKISCDDDLVRESFFAGLFAVISPALSAVSVGLVCCVLMAVASLQRAESRPPPRRSQ